MKGKKLPLSTADIGIITKDVLSLEKNPKYHVQFLRSLIVSVAALIVDFSTLVFLKQVLGVHYIVAATLAFALGVLVNYFLSVNWVFTERQMANKTHEFIIFVVITGLGLIFNILIIAGMVELLHSDYRVGKAVSTVVVFFWNFVARKKILY
jgi:putative flippase GtrA